MKKTRIRKRRELKGIKMGKLTFLEPRAEDKWLCKCECGVKKEFFTANIMAGTTKSCGCARVSLIRAKAKERYAALAEERYAAQKSAIKEVKKGQKERGAACEGRLLKIFLFSKFTNEKMVSYFDGHSLLINVKNMIEQKLPPEFGCSGFEFLSKEEYENLASSNCMDFRDVCRKFGTRINN